MAGRLRGGAVAALLAPVAWVIVMFALAGPLALSSHAATPTHPAAAGAASHVQAAPATGMDDPDNGHTDGSPGVLGLPPKVHLIVNRTGTGTAPLPPVLAVLAAPVDRTDAGIRLASGRAAAPPADALPRNSLWGRAPPRASA